MPKITYAPQPMLLKLMQVYSNVLISVYSRLKCVWVYGETFQNLPNMTARFYKWTKTIAKSSYKIVQILCFDALNHVLRNLNWTEEQSLFDRTWSSVSSPCMATWRLRSRLGRVRCLPSLQLAPEWRRQLGLRSHALQKFLGYFGKIFEKNCRT